MFLKAAVKMDQHTSSLRTQTEHESGEELEGNLHWMHLRIPASTPAGLHPLEVGPRNTRVQY